MMAERMKLTVTETKEPQPIGDKGAKKLAFKATNAEGKELAYITWRTQLFPHIAVGSEVDAEVETTTREYEGNVYTDRKVIQLYIDGQPVSKGSSGDGKWRSKSPEEMELSRRSFALAYAKDLVVAGKIEIGDLLNQAIQFEQFMVGEKPEEKTQEINRSSEDIQQSQDTHVEQVMGEMVAKRGWNETVCRTTLVEIAKENKWTVKGATAEAILSNWDSGILAAVLTRVKQYPIVGA